MHRFLGRERELQLLLDLAQKRSASFVVIKGRRRIGKSRLVEELAKHFTHFYTISGLAPDPDKPMTARMQLDEFSLQMSRQFKMPKARYDDWGDAFWAIGERVQSGKVLLFFDEISWMGSEDPTFLGKIKNFWDLQLKKNPNLLFVICGSASAWIEKNILSKTGFVGRISQVLTLEELPLSVCSQFWPKQISAYEKLKIFAITGGIPKYLEEVYPQKSAEENIKRLCFMPGGFLVEEFDRIFSGIFLRSSKFYKLILEVLEKGQHTQREIFKELSFETRPGRLSEYLWELELAGFISKDHAWSFKSGRDVRARRYRLSDNYIRFYLKYIEKNRSKIDRNAFAFKSLTTLPEWNAIMGLQCENLILHNRHKLRDLLKIPPEDVICENPYFQKASTRNPGCQIDYLIQTKFGTLYVCEIKFSKSPIGSSIIQEMETKIKALKPAPGFSYRPVLIHVNGVTEEVVDADYFAAIIDLGQLLLIEKTAL
jgi:uncharacterized protein